MKLACEIPINYLEECGRSTDFDFVLAHMLLEDRKYAQYYQKVQDTSCRKMILDNGLFELGKPVTVGDLLTAAEMVKPDVVIVPDFLGDAAKTVTSYEEFKVEQSAYLPTKTKLSVVVQGSSLAEAINCYKFFAAEKDVECICIPFGNIYSEFKSLNKSMAQMCSRIALIEELTRKNLVNVSKWHHLLGANLPYELQYLAQYNWIYSIDSSIPFISVMKDQPLLKVTSKLIRPSDYFEYALDYGKVSRFHESIRNLKSIIA